ncbi:hypothetical protein LCGC14_1767860, partial [marine sediment metagenome]
GVDANSTLGQLVAGFSVLAAQIPGLKSDLRAGRAVGGALARDSEGNRDFVGAAQGVIGGIGAIAGATRQGSTASRTGRGALAGAAAGAQVAGPIGAAIGAAAGAITGFIRGRRAEGRFREIQDAIGLRVSDALREGIEQAADDLDISLRSAALLNLGAAIEEAGGITEENLEQLSQSFNRLMAGVAAGTLPMEEGLEAINDAFFVMVDSLAQMGAVGAVEIGNMVRQMRTLGVVTDEVQAQIADFSRAAVDNLSVFLDFLTTQFGDDGTFQGDMEAAATNVGILAATFSAAVEAAGSLAGAVALLPDSFGGLITQFRELLGSENSALNALTRFYNFATENQEQLSAIAALTSSMDDLAAAGILNSATINDFGGAAILQMQDLLASTEDQNTALLAMAPEIANLIQMYNAMGVAVPADLQAIADAAIEAGASLVPPQGVEDILGGIRDIMIEIAVAMGVARDTALQLGGAIGSIPAPPGPTGPGPSDRDREFGGGDDIPGFSHGGFIPETFPAGRVIRVAEPGTGGEDITPRRGGTTGGAAVARDPRIDALADYIENGRLARDLARAVREERA